MNPRPCVRCGHRPSRGRGLCNPCLSRASRRGELDRYDRVTHPRTDVVEDAELMASTGANWLEACTRLGYSTNCSPARSGLRQALKRAGRLDLWKQLREAA